MIPLVQTSFVPGWAITIPLLIAVGLLVWMIFAPSDSDSDKGDDDE